MSTQESSNMGPMSNAPMNYQSSMPQMMQAYPQMAAAPAMENAMTYEAVYPEIYYKLKPYITMTIDIIFLNGAMMPTQQ